MPNWCENELTIEGPENEIQEFLRFIGDGKEIAEKFIPYPEEFKKQDKIVLDYQKTLISLDENSRNLARALHNPRDSYNDGGYEWCCSNWDTKWDFDCEVMDAGKNFLQAEFMTPWSPPKRVIFAMSTKFPNLLFTLDFKEEGMDFQGTYQLRDGEELDDFLENIPTKEKEDENNEN